MKKLCKLNKTSLKKHLKCTDCIYKCKKCGRRSDFKKELCKIKS